MLVWQGVRMRRALHVFQLEGYKRRRFWDWCAHHPRRALFLNPLSQKKPLVMTGRAWRLWITALVVTAALLLVPAGAAHLALGGAPADLVTWAVSAVLAFVFAPAILIAADVLMSPVQASINSMYLSRARRRLADQSPVVVGVTGSFGKTSTKFAVRSLLGGDPHVLATPASFNTPLGVCRTINESLGPEHRYLVVEMGAYGRGEIAELCRFVRPRIGVLTAIGPAHLERFGSIEAIERAKYELIAALPADGTAVMNVDDSRIRRLADETIHVPVVRYGIDPGGRPDVTARDIKVSPQGTAFLLEHVASRRSLAVQTALLGEFAVLQVLAAAAVAVAVGQTLEDLGPRIARLAPVEHRLQLIETGNGVIVIDDAFNSNPAGAAAALDVLAQMPAARRIVVTPGMVELGDLQAVENERFAAHAARVADVLIAVAPVNRAALVAGAAGENADTDVVVVDNLADATEHLATLLRPGDAVLFENDLPDQYEA